MLKYSRVPEFCQSLKKCGLHFVCKILQLTSITGKWIKLNLSYFFLLARLLFFFQEKKLCKKILSYYHHQKYTAILEFQSLWKSESFKFQTQPELIPIYILLWFHFTIPGFCENRIPDDWSCPNKHFIVIIALTIPLNM